MRVVTSPSGKESHIESGVFTLCGLLSRGWKGKLLAPSGATCKVCTTAYVARTSTPVRKAIGAEFAKSRGATVGAKLRELFK